MSIFFRETGIHPDTFDISDVKVHCKHVTTVFDNGASIKRNGLIPLNRLLEEPSLLRTFLLENGIEISPREQYISINGMKHWIPMGSRGCDTNEWENVGLLSAILFHDHGEVEAFIAGDHKEIIGYSMFVMRCQMNRRKERQLYSFLITLIFGIQGETTLLRSPQKSISPLLTIIVPIQKRSL